jgi:hypothetical protein
MTIAERLSALGLALAGGLAPAAACTPADVTGPPEQACQDYAYAYCEQLKACSTTYVAQTFGDQPACEALIKAACFNDLSAPSTGDSVSQRQACTQAVGQGAWACSDILSSQNPPTPCQTLPGGLSNGQPCGVKNQCHSTFCSIAPGQGCGTCADPPSIGAPCPTSECAIGQVCIFTTQTCGPHAGAGSPCSTDQPCDQGLSCVYPSGSTMGTCQAGVTMAGASCEIDNGGCSFNAGLACNAAMGTCQAARLASPGEACGVVGDQSTQCALGRCIRGACVGFPPLGAPCEIGGSACAPPGYCISADGGTAGTCQLRSAAFCP